MRVHICLVKCTIDIELHFFRSYNPVCVDAMCRMSQTVLLKSRMSPGMVYVP